MSNLVIVAIPDENDRVWKVSSEQVPHLTLLFLGDQSNISNLDKITEFVGHAADTTLQRFYLPVDRRGELGDDQELGPADVLFFRRSSYDFKAIWDFRSNLLKDNNIKTAYDNASQFDGPWQPHLTLGYQGRPAKPDPTDHDYGFYDVSFTKIAVWNDNYAGTEFLLKDWWDEFQALATVPMDVAMSMSADVKAEFLAHAAKISNTPWGDFKASDYSDEEYARACLLDRGTAVEKAKDRYSLPVREPDGTLNSNGCHAAAAVLSSKGGSGSARGNKIKDATPEQVNAARQKLVSLYNDVLKEDPPEGLVAQDAKAKHSDAASGFLLERYGIKQIVIPDVVAEPGRVTGLGAQFLAHQGLAVRDPDEVDAFMLEHYGVKGMHWGQHKAAPEPVTPTATSHVPSAKTAKTKIKVGGGENHPAHEDAIRVAKAQAKLKKSGAAALSNNELRDVATRVQLEQQVKNLTAHGGKRFVAGLLKNQGQQSAGRVITRKLVTRGL